MRRVNPYCLSAPVSPHLAARDTGVSIELQRIQRQFRDACGGRRLW